MFLSLREKILGFRIVNNQWNDGFLCCYSRENCVRNVSTLNWVGRRERALKPAKLSLPLLICGFLGMAGTLIADENLCLEGEELINLNASELGSALPCDYIGAYCLLGLGEVPNHSLSLSDTDIDSNYAYYLYFRTYLYSKTQGVNTREDSFASLLLGLAIAPQPSFPVTYEIDRANYYSSFAVAEYWRENSDLLSGTKVDLREMVLLLNDGGALQNMTHVRCFIKYDIPTIDPTLVVGSELYNFCIDSE